MGHVPSTMGSVSSASRRTILRGGTLVTMNPAREVGVGDLVLEGGRIIGVSAGEGSTRADDEILDVRGRLVIPGLVQAHVHLCQTLFRGRADDLELLDWLREKIWPFEAAHTRESLYLSALLGACELLRSGTTAILDMGTVHHTDAIFEAVSRVGLRATIGKAMMDAGQGVPPGLSETTEASLEESLALAARWHGRENGRLRYAFAPRFVLSCTEALLARVVREARARGLGMHTHASENASELSAVRAQCGRDNVEYLHALGMSGPDTVLAHCIWLSAGEEQILARTGTHVAHCPSSNLKLASGVAKIPELLDLGVNVGIGADGAPCNNRLDGFEELRLAALLHKPRVGPRGMPARQVFELATLGGARALGLETEIGSLEEGKKADVVVVNPRQLHVAPLGDPYSMLVYAIDGRDVEHVFVDGILRVRDGRVLGVDVPELVQQATEEADRLAGVAR